MSPKVTLREICNMVYQQSTDELARQYRNTNLTTLSSSVHAPFRADDDQSGIKTCDRDGGSKATYGRLRGCNAICLGGLTGQPQNSE